MHVHWLQSEEPEQDTVAAFAQLKETFLSLPLQHPTLLTKDKTRKIFSVDPRQVIHAHK